MSVDEIRGDHVRLVKPVADDRKAFLEAMKKSRSLHHPWVFPPLDAEAYERFLRNAAQSGEAVYLVKDNTDGGICGVVALNLIVYRALCSACVSYYGVRGRNGQGSIREGLSVLIGHAFEDLGLNRLEANIQPGNTPSLELARSLGFRREGFSPRFLNIGGTWRDHERWAMLSHEFKPHH